LARFGAVADREGVDVGEVLRAEGRDWTRGLIGAIGLVCVAAGGVVAWRADAATPLLVAGVLLVLLAMLGDRVQEILLKQGDKEMRLQLQQLQHAGERTVAAISAVESNDHAEAQQQLEQARMHLRLLHHHIERTSNPRPPSARLRCRIVKPFHNSLGADLEPDAEMNNGYATCRWSGPDGLLHSMVMSASTVDSQPIQALLVPDAAGDSVAPGEYTVSWFWGYSVEMEGAREVASCRAVVSADAPLGWVSDWF
jgi:hypothetical protein